MIKEIKEAIERVKKISETVSKIKVKKKAKPLEELIEEEN